MSFFSPAVVSMSPLTLLAGDELVDAPRHRVLVHDGRWDAGRLNAERAEYDRQTRDTK